MEWDEVKSFIASLLGALVAGWWSKVVALLTDPIVSAATQIASRAGWVVLLLIVTLIIKQTYDDYKGYLAMGVFAVPAIIAFLLPWDAATTLMALSSAVLAFMGRDVLRELLGK